MAAVVTGAVTRCLCLTGVLFALTKLPGAQVWPSNVRAAFKPYAVLWRHCALTMD